jgi:hypothetical protein
MARSPEQQGRRFAHNLFGESAPFLENGIGLCSLEEVRTIL